MATKVIFDPIQKLVIVKPGITELDVRVDLYSSGKVEWLTNDTLNQYKFFMNPVGGDPIGANQFAPSYFFLVNGWKIRTWEGDHELFVNSNLYTADGSDPFVSTLGNYNVKIELNNSNVPVLQVAGGLTIEQAASIQRILDIMEADESFTPTLATKFKKGTTEILIQKNVQGGDLNSTIEIKE